jgi:hypothetical protein
LADSVKILIFCLNLPKNQYIMCGCNGRSRRSKPKADVPTVTQGTNQMLVQQNQQQQQRERSLQKQIMAKNRPIIKR